MTDDTNDKTTQEDQDQLSEASDAVEEEPEEDLFEPSTPSEAALASERSDAQEENAAAATFVADEESEGLEESSAEEDLAPVVEQPVVEQPVVAAPAVEEPLEEPLHESSLSQDSSDVEDIEVFQPGVPGAGLDGWAAYFDYPGELLHAAEVARDSSFEKWDIFSPFPIHGFEEAMGIGRSWLPWVTFVAGGTGFLLANLLQFGTLTFDWPMIIGGKPYAPWPSFVPIMFELTVLIGGVTTALVMFLASGCFRKPRIIDPEITNDRFVLWIDAKDPNFSQAHAFMESLDPVEIRPITFEE